MKVLIIEDDPIQALNLKIQLRELGFSDAVVANNLVGLTHALVDAKFDLVFCDIHLPDVDGITLLAEHLQSEAIRAVVIVSVVEDSVLKLAQGMCNQLGFGYVNTLNKPYLLDDLVEVLRNVQDFFESSQQPNLAEHVLLSEEEVHELLTEEHLFSVYQPQFSFISGQLIGVEALARIEHKEFGVLSPASFLPLVHQLGLMRTLFMLMLKKSTAALSVLEQPIRLSINIAQALLDEDLYELTVRICEENNYPMSFLTMELTEDQAYNSSPRALANIARLKVKGVNFAIDDFGTGYASLEQLIDLPFSEIKIDRRFIARVKDDYKHQQLTTSILRLSQSLGLHCVAEGVEDLVTWEFLRELGVDACQGYYTGKPMAISELLPLYQVALNDESITINEVHKVILLLDANATRGKAMVRLLTKELPQFSLHHVSCLDDTLNLIRDLPVAMVVFEHDYVQALDEPQKVLLSNIKQRVEVVALMANSSVDPISLGSASVMKSESIAATARDVSIYITQMETGQRTRELTRLSERESHVAKLLLAGFTNKYIAYELGISQKTVSTFKRRIFSKLGVKSILELADALKCGQLLAEEF